MANGSADILKLLHTNYSSGGLVSDSNSTWHLEIGGPLAGSGYDQIVTNLDAVLDGNLEISLMNGYFPHDGEIFDLIKTMSPEGSLSGAFANAPAGTFLIDGHPFMIQYTPDTVRLIAVPEPGSLCIGLIGITVFGRRRMSRAHRWRW
jgi:hypothetical protein